MSYQLNFSLIQPINPPLKVNEAMQLGKRKLEQLGMVGQFEGYRQPGRSLQQDIAEHEVVAPGSVLSFAAETQQGARTEPERITALERAVHALQRTAAKPLLRNFVSLVATHVIGKGPLSAAAMKQPDREHVNDNAHLEALANELDELSALELLRVEMPIECAVLRDYKELL